MKVLIALLFFAKFAYAQPPRIYKGLDSSGKVHTIQIEQKALRVDSSLYIPIELPCLDIAENSFNFYTKVQDSSGSRLEVVCIWTEESLRQIKIGGKTLFVN